MAKSLLTAALGAGLIVLSSVAFAQSGGPTKDLVGKDLVDPKGETIGEVVGIDGNDLVIGVGGFLGIGEREVAIPFDKVTETGAGDDLKLQTNMTKRGLASLPDYKPSANVLKPLPPAGK